MARRPLRVNRERGTIVFISMNTGVNGACMQARRWVLSVGVLLALAGQARADAAQDQFRRATELLLKGEARAAAGAFQDLLATQPQFAQADVAGYRLGEALLQAGDAAGARAAFEAVLRTYPRSERAPAAHYMLAQLLLSQEPARAAAHYAAAADAADPALAEPASFGRAEALYQAAQWPAAAAAYTRVLTTYPHSTHAPQALYSRGWALFQSRDYAGATRDLLAFAGQDPTNALAAACRIKAGESSFLQAAATEQAGETNAALAGYAAAIQLSGTNDVAQRATIACLRLELAAGRHASVCNRARSFMAACPSSPLLPRAAFYYGGALLALERPAEALDAYRQAGHDDPAAAYGAACALRKLGHHAEAAALFAHVAVGQSPYAADAAVWAARAREDAAADLFRNGELAYASGRFDVAASNYEAALSDAAGCREPALYKLGWTHIRQQQPDAACQSFLQLAREFPQSAQAPEARFRAGRFLQHAGRFDDARASLLAVTNGPFAAQASLLAADCLRAAGRLDDAMSAYGALLNGTNKTRAAAQALLGQGYCLFAQRKWEEAARSFLKVDLLYDDESLKPEALAMIVKSWDQAGDAVKAASYRAELKARYPLWPAKPATAVSEP